MIKIIVEKRYDNIFNTNKADGSIATELIPGNKENEYYLNNKNLKGKIVYMTPREYFNNCIKYCFPNMTFDELVYSRAREKDANDYIINRMETDNKLNIPYIDIAYKGQEGLHRMYVCAQKYGWDESEFPVLVIDYADYDRQKNIELNKEKKEIQYKIDDIVKECLSYEYSSTEEVSGQLEWEIEKVERDCEIEIAYESYEDYIKVYSVKYPDNCFANINFTDIKINTDRENNIDDYDYDEDLSIEEIDKQLNDFLNK